MMHFFRGTKIHLDCFTHRRDVIEYAPVVEAIKVIPGWWKQLPKDAGIHFFPTATMRTCKGMYNYYAKSIAIPLWSDLCLHIKEDTSFEWQFSDRLSNAGTHGVYQYEGFPATNSYKHIKIMSPWLFKTKDSVNWIMTDPVYHHTDFRDYVLAQGLLEFRNNGSTHMQLLIDTSSPRVYTIPFGTPFMLTPMSDKKVVLHRHLVSVEEYESIHQCSTASTFINKSIIHKHVTQCPYKDKIK